MRRGALTLAMAIGLAFSSISSALPTNDAGLYNFLSKRLVSPDNTCGDAFNGANNSYSCDATVNAGGCCSQYGFCGNTSDYCNAGCQSTFGTCLSSGTSQPSTSDFTCGPANSNQICSSGLCCSGAGFCGNTTDYCDAGCQSGYGLCDAAFQNVGAGTCGPNFGNQICPSGQCCSMAGYCGTTEDYCADPANCMLGYGECDSSRTPSGPSTANVPRPFKGPVTYTDDILDCVQNKVVALSYDDGPYNYTESLLDLLQTYGFKATFFITGNNNGKGQIDLTAPYPSLIQRMIADGHQVASHTWSHYSLSNVTQDTRISQMVKNEMAFNNIIGKWPTYMRPPYSDCTEESGCWADLEALGYHRVYFDLDTQDYLNPLPSQIQNSKDIVKAALQAPGITDYLSIQHDIVQQSVANLSSYYFDLIKAKGWKGVTVAECLGDTDSNNWYRSFNESSSSITSSTSKSTTLSTERGTTTTSQPITTSTTTSSSKFSTTATPSTLRLSTTASSLTSSPTTVLSSKLSTTTTTITTPSTTPSTLKLPTTQSSPTAASTSKTSTATLTTLKPSTTIKSTTSTSSTVSATPTPPKARCEFANGNWCGNIASFTNKQSCDQAAASCYGGTLSCLFGGFSNLLACGNWSALCAKLSGYCLTKCNSGNCNNAGFGY